MQRVTPALWRPHDIELEPAADDAVRDVTQCTVIVAGPGSGKTELLAQKACFLLETHTCPWPHRILAVSFKRDAARNLKDRVILRSGRKLASRFDSLTFDAFSKGLFDRFRAALPAVFRPSADYRIDFGIQRARDMRDLLEQLPPREGLTTAEIQQIQERTFENRYLCGVPLDAAGIQGTQIGHRAARALWGYLLHEQAPSRVSFPMISRLVDLLLRTNPHLLAALRQTYRFVFLDEFQDTTSLQYALTRTCFLGTSANLTAVGDGKQRIMAWAGALDGIFAAFQEDFAAVQRRLLYNFRSAPRLVEMQHAIVMALEGRDVARSVSRADSGTDGECFVLSFPDHEREANYLAERVANWITNDGLAPRDICILTRQRVEQYTEVLVQALAEQGIQGRVESELQDLLAEPITTLVIHLLRLLVQRRCAVAWEEIVEMLVRVRGSDTDEAERSMYGEIRGFLEETRGLDLGNATDENDVRSLVERIVAFVGRDALASIYPQYEQGEYLGELLVAITTHLVKYRAGRGWVEALDHFEGKTSVPIMTIHKSKGLEYHTIIFVGLEDSALWGFARNPAEETCAFFVAFSRAKQRVLFSLCQTRPGRFGIEQQTTDSIEPLYQLLDEAGVERLEIE
jgi:DNA helicase II / ATP-dependent DNA helicase PcrA